MKNNQNRNVFAKETFGLHWGFQRFMKNSLMRKNSINFDTSESLIQLHEKLQIVFANIRV
ncbi:MAG: hypothetical protein Q8K02_00250 [Flavobacterium sp.]|nr:hypothetical protein [Flavobacterium sp.]